MQATSAEWYYIGHYGQLGPLTLEQVDDLVSGGVILRDTYVWRTGMNDWIHADRVAELRPSFATADPYAAPPPPPSGRPTAPAHLPSSAPAMGGWQNDAMVRAPQAYPAFGAVKSDRSRVLAGILNLFLPGVGRIYLGHAAHGVLQLVLFFCGGVGWVWSFVDGIIILAGGVKYDGYGRVLAD